MAGYRFNPFDEEVISDYLKPKILGMQLPDNTIKNRQVYGPFCNPWQVFDSDDPSWLKAPQLKPTQKFMFVFTKLSKLSGDSNSKNTSKKAGCGTWVGKTSRKKIMDGNGDVIGESRYLVFEINETDSAAVDFRKVGFYTMHEYSLSGINQGLDSADKTVVCKITHDSSKKTNLDLQSGTKFADCVSGTSSESQIKEENNNLEGMTAENPTVIDGGGDCENLDESKALTSKNLIAMDIGVGDYLEEGWTLASDALVVRNNDVGDCYDVTPQFDIDFHDLDAFGGGFCFADQGGEDFCSDGLDEFNTDWLTACLDSHYEEEPVENSTFCKPGKRKFEAIEESYQTKKMCL